MSFFGCNCRCTRLALLISAVLGVLTAFLQITGTVTATATFLWVVAGIAVVYLGILLLTGPLASRGDTCPCKCATLTAVLVGILGTVLFAATLLALGIVATSILSAIAVGILVFFFSLTLTSTACLIRCLSGCES